jgi:Polyphosphate kinase 2 (PPK2)
MKLPILKIAELTCVQRDTISKRLADLPFEAGKKGAELYRSEDALAAIYKSDSLEAARTEHRNFEQYLTRNGVIVRKFFLHVSKKEQKRRFLERIDDTQKNWKFSSNDAAERDFWDDYMEAYEEMIQETATKDAPWYVVPADNKWFTRVVVAAAVVETLADLDLGYPKVGKDKLKELATAKGKLLKK